MKILDLAKAISLIDEDEKVTSKENVVERLDYLSTKLQFLYSLAEVEDNPEEQYALGDVLNLLDLLKKDYKTK
jgi:hypothetical protein